METVIRPKLHQVMTRAADNLIPFQVSIELTHRCNLRCKHCYIDVKASDEMTFPEIKDILDQLFQAGTMYLMFTGGEILVRPDFLDIARYARKMNFLLILLTNGTLITGEIAAELARLEPVLVGMSIHGSRPETHDGITGRIGSFRDLLNAISLLKRWRVPIALQGNIMDTNVNEISEIKSLARDLGVSVRLSSDMAPSRSGSLDPYSFQVASPQVCKEMGQQWVEESRFTRDVGPCKAGKGICSISPNGDVFPCLLMPMKIGNLRENSFSDIWKTRPCESLSALRSITVTDLTECFNCSIAQYCHRCLGVAYSETGSLTRPAPSACRNATFKFSYITNRKGVLV